MFRAKCGIGFYVLFTSRTSYMRFLRKYGLTNGQPGLTMNTLRRQNVICTRALSFKKLFKYRTRIADVFQSFFILRCSFAYRKCRRTLTVRDVFLVHRVLLFSYFHELNIEQKHVYR